MGNFDRSKCCRFNGLFCPRGKGSYGGIEGLEDWQGPAVLFTIGGGLFSETRIVGSGGKFGGLDEGEIRWPEKVISHVPRMVENTGIAGIGFSANQPIKENHSQANRRLR